MVLDHDDLQTKVQTFRAGFSFAMPIVITGVVISLAGLLIALLSPIAGAIIFILGGLMCTASYGFQLDARNDRFREYTSVFGIKRGSWLKLSDYPDVAVLSGKKGTTVRSLSNRSTSTTEATFTVHLLTPTHRTRVPIKSFKEPAEAKDFAQHLASSLNKRSTSFSPKISEATMRRR